MEHTKDRPSAPNQPEPDAAQPAQDAAAPGSGQTWNPAAYIASGRFVADLATAVVDLLGPQPGEEILDIGCGDGALTEQIAATGARVTGIDASESMVRAARERGLAVEAISAREIPFVDRFDAAFSNAALHWIPEAEQPSSLAAIHRALKPGAQFVAEMGGQGNIAAIRTALLATLSPIGVDPEAVAASFFPSPERYRRLLEEAGFTISSIGLYPRPTPLPGGHGGMRTWLTTFRNGVFEQLDPDDRNGAIEATVGLLAPVLQDASTGEWTADYVRLRFYATRS